MFEVMFYKKKKWTVCQSLMSTHCGIQHYCDESLWQHRHNSFHKEKEKLW